MVINENYNSNMYCMINKKTATLTQENINTFWCNKYVAQKCSSLQNRENIFHKHLHLFLY